jgi:F-type H+-transporting ATPase subunit a
MVDVSPQGLFGTSWLRDTVVSTWIMMAVVVVAVLIIRRRWPIVLEWLVEFLDGTVASTIGRPTDIYLPFLGTLVLFLAVANIFGIVPSTVTPTRDISTPAAMALIVLVAVNYFGIRAKGGLGYLRHLTSPVFMLPLELIGQLSRTLSLTLRLFGNIVSTELVVAVIYALVPPIMPLPVIILGMFTGVLQSYIFIVLTTSYIASATRSTATPGPEPAAPLAEGARSA